MPRNTEKSPIEFKRIVREIYRQCSRGNDNREVRHDDCADCGNIEHHLSVRKDDVESKHPTGVTCVNCCAIFDEINPKNATIPIIVMVAFF